jgi:site-specific DNA recombinase
MTRKQVAVYARVSGETQAAAHTIASQIEALHERVATDGCQLLAEHEFLDDGYSGNTLVRPALEQLRDLIASGSIDCVYIHSPDRLARRYAYQVLLVEEWQRAGVEVVFLNRLLGHSAEDELLLQVQGVMAEYERAKILERCRRGRRHTAQRGSVSVLGIAPFGYRYVTIQEGGGEARFEVVPEEARVVQQIFAWAARERANLGEIRRRLREAGHLTQTGLTLWDRSTIRNLLRNPAYMGQAAFGRRRNGPRQARLRPVRGKPQQPRRDCSIYRVEEQDWIRIPVPALVDAEVFATVQEQLQENQKRNRQRRNSRGHYLLAGLVCCTMCGRSLSARMVSKDAKGVERRYGYYRCTGTDPYRFGGTAVCTNGQVRIDLLEETVWREVCYLLRDPQRIEQEYRRRLQEPSQNDELLVRAEAQIARSQQAIDRLIDGYTEGYIDKAAFTTRMERSRERLTRLAAEAQGLREEAHAQAELQLLVSRLEDFSLQLGEQLDRADWAVKRAVICAAVKRIDIGPEEITIVFRVDPTDPSPNSSGESLSHCGKRGSAGAFSRPNHRLRAQAARGRFPARSDARGREDCQRLPGEKAVPLGVLQVHRQEPAPRHRVLARNAKCVGHSGPPTAGAAPRKSDENTRPDHKRGGACRGPWRRPPHSTAGQR